MRGKVSMPLIFLEKDCGRDSRGLKCIIYDIKYLISRYAMPPSANGGRGLPRIIELYIEWCSRNLTILFGQTLPAVGGKGHFFCANACE